MRSQSSGHKGYDGLRRRLRRAALKAACDVVDYVASGNPMSSCPSRASRVEIRRSPSKQPPSVTTPMTVAMPTSIAGTIRCQRKPTPRPIAIPPPIPCADVPCSEPVPESAPRSPYRATLLDRSPGATVTPSAAHHDDGGLLRQAGRLPSLLPVARTARGWGQSIASDRGVRQR